MNAELYAGLKVMGYGLAGVFSTLLLLYLAIVILKKVMPFKKK